MFKMYVVSLYADIMGDNIVAIFSNNNLAENYKSILIRNNEILPENILIYEDYLDSPVSEGETIYSIQTQIDDSEGMNKYVPYETQGHFLDLEDANKFAAELISYNYVVPENLFLMRNVVDCTNDLVQIN